MKKVFSILLGMTLMFSLVGCGAIGSFSDNKSGVYAEDGYGEGEMGDVIHTYYEDAVSDEQLPEIYELKHKESRTGLLVFEVPEDSGDDYSISYLEEFDDDTEGDTFFVYCMGLSY